VQLAATSDTAVDVASAGLGAAFAPVAGPAGAVLVAVTVATGGDMLKQLTRRQAKRMEKLTEITASQVLARVAEGAERRGDIDSEEATTLIEGVLLQARRSYEEKKVPLLANLLATAPFTGTPLANLIAPLEIIERLRYRQLCILALIPGYDPNDYPPLTNETIGDLYAANPVGETAEGVLADLIDLVRQRLVAQTVNRVIQEVPDGQIRPALLRLTYPALLVSNGARLRATIPEEDLVGLRTILAQHDRGVQRHPPVATR
jgi:hypothetical protein